MNGNYCSKLDDCSYELNTIKQWIDNNKFETNVRFLINYSVIKACGTIESVFKEVVFDFLAEGSKEENKNFLTVMILNSSSNPSPGNITKLLEKIDNSLARDFDNKIKGSQEKGQLKSLVELRNSFAHGSNINSSIEDVVSFFNSGRYIIEVLLDCLYQN